MDTPSVKIKIIASENNWIEGAALNQIRQTATKSAMKYAVGLPDLHPGRGIPIGSAFLTEGIFNPYLIGNDIGCGIGLWQTDTKITKIRQDKWVKKLKNLDDPWEGDMTSFMIENGLNPTNYNPALGTIGGGNHFAEFTKVETVEDQTLFEELGLDKSRLMLMVHSGSRGLGQFILRQHTEKFGDKGLDENSPEAEFYLKNHDDTLKWAKANRKLIARRFTEKLGMNSQPVCDVFHNCLEKTEKGWLHRKGAALASNGPLVIAGSRGTLSYLVQPTNQTQDNLWTVAHGAGRKWKRSEAKPRLSRKYGAEDLRRTKCGNRVICSDKELLYEEAPQAYKNIDVVIDDLVQEGLIKVIAKLEPVITYKTNRERRK